LRAVWKSPDSPRAILADGRELPGRAAVVVATLELAADA